MRYPLVDQRDLNPKSRRTVTGHARRQADRDIPITGTRSLGSYYRVERLAFLISVNHLRSGLCGHAVRWVHDK